jgi:hypothetical protein
VAWRSKSFSGIMLGVGFPFLNGLASHLGLLDSLARLDRGDGAQRVCACTRFSALLAWVDRAR